MGSRAQNLVLHADGVVIGVDDECRCHLAVGCEQSPHQLDDSDHLFGVLMSIVEIFLPW